MAAAPVLVAVDPVTLDPAPVDLGALIAAVIEAPLVVAAVVAEPGAADPLAAAQSGEVLAPDPGGELDALGRGAEVIRLTASSVPRALDLAVQEVGAELLVAGSKADGGAGRITPGRTTARLLAGARCPLALVPRGWAAPGALATIGAGFLDTAEGREAVHRAHELARRSGATLRVLAALSPPSPEARALAEEAARDAVPTAPGVRVDVDVAEVEPADDLVGVSVELDLLVCGARSYGNRPAVLPGADTHRVSAEAACPVLFLA
jgi:nucleotide-binding universal stress UspA family protein